VTREDAKKLQRTAQRLVVEARRGSGSPPSYGDWESVWGAKVDRIEINRDAKPSVATIWFPHLRWEQTPHLVWGDSVRIRTNEPDSTDRTILFAGFITSYLSDFSGGTEQPNTAYERNAIVCQDYRWLLAATSPITGQVARSPDDYNDFGRVYQTRIDGSWTWLSGRRIIFNIDGKPNRDPHLLVLQDSSGEKLCEIPIFANPCATAMLDADIAIPWTARDMMRYVLCSIYNKAYQYLPIEDPNALSGLDHSDWDKVINHVVVNGLNVIEAVQFICRQIGWGFREDYNNDDTVAFVFYKIGAAAAYTRDSDNMTILHKLHAPAVGESIAPAVEQGKKLLWSMQLAEDISAVVNSPLGLGAPHRFEFTAELVPAWLDTDLEPDTSEDNANLFFIEAELQEMTEPNNEDYYKYYHPRGSQFRRNVGRKWALNESGLYSNNYTYKRGMPFDFSKVVPDEYILDSEGKRIYAPFNRQLLPCLTMDKDKLNSVGIRVEFSFDSGQTWQVLPAAISSLKEECGLYIEEANIAEMADEAEGSIDDEEGPLDGVQLNYFTSLCDDKLNNRSFDDGEWKTRIRVTASVQLDRRLGREAMPSGVSGSPFHHSQVYDFSEKYGLLKRTESSIFAGTEQPAYEMDSTDYFDRHLEAVRKANEDMSISGQFTLERLWLGDGSGRPDFALGDCIEKITGREYELSATFGGGKVYPEIVQLIYLPDRQRMKLITRDLRFAEVLL